MIEIKTGIFENNENNNIYLVGDIHGDYQCVIHILVDLCKVCKITRLYKDEEFNTENREYLEWIPNNNSIIIFCGDIIHRKRFKDHVLDDECSDIFLIKTLLRLKSDAINNNGNILLIAGNHEIMNIINPLDNTYTSDKNTKINLKYFQDKNFINEYINNSYAWIKINNILISHGGLCSDYLKYLDYNNIFENRIYNESKEVNNNINMLGGTKINCGNDIIEFINNKYRTFFNNFEQNKINTDKDSYRLFIECDINNKTHHNMFWCREWGYSGIDCNKFKMILKKIDCKKMIIAHCPQFISPNNPKMINFECINEENNDYNIARIDLGMSRCFDYNKKKDFLYYLENNYNRKISILKLDYNTDNNELFFNTNSIITKKISCIQYLLLKYGIKKEEWKKYNIDTNWLGFEYINNVLSSSNNDLNYKNIILSLLEPILNNKNFESIHKFKELLK